MSCKQEKTYFILTRTRTTVPAELNINLSVCKIGTKPIHAGGQGAWGGSEFFSAEKVPKIPLKMPKIHEKLPKKPKK